MSGIEMTEAVVGKLISRASREITHGCQVPGEMSLVTFLLLQARAEEMELEAARGQDCVDGFGAEREEVETLMSASQWTLHPDYGYVLRSAVARLNAGASETSPPADLGQRLASLAEYGDRPEAVLSTDEIASMTAMVEAGMCTTNGDAGTMEISTRQLALLLHCAVGGGAR